MTERTSVIRSVRTVAESALLGAVILGVVLGWSPIASAIDVHAVGAVLGAGLGALAKAKHFI